MPPKAKKQKIVRSPISLVSAEVVSSTATGLTRAPVSAVAARRQQLIDASSKTSSPEEEEHIQVDNVDVDEDDKDSLDSSSSVDSEDDDNSDQDLDNGEVDLSSSVKGVATTPQHDRRDRKVFLDPLSVSTFKPTRYNFACVSSPGKPDLMLVGMRRGETIVFQGCVKVIPLIGQTTVLGHIMSGTADRRSGSKKLTENSVSRELDLSSVSVFPVISPRTHALATIESISLAKSQREALVFRRPASTSLDLKTQLKTLAGQLALDDFDSVLAIQSSLDCGIVGIEKVVPLFKGILSMKQTSRRRGMEDEEKQLQVRFETCVNGFHPILDPTDSIAALKLPQSWKDAMQALVADTEDENGRRVKRPPVSVVCGGKKMGKSTFSRLILNRMLNRYRKVAFIECDIGQSEFTPVGMVALHIVETPALGAPFTHPRQPYRAFFVGNSTPRDDPDYYMACIKELIKTYYSEVSHTRSWADMDDDYHSDEEEDDHIPLIINTQGWIKGTGYDLLLQLLDYTGPSHIFGFHSPSLGDSNLPQSFFSTLKEQAVMSGHQHPSFYYVAAVVLGEDNTHSPFTKYHPADHRALALLSYFYLKQGEAGGLGMGDGGSLTWDFNQALVVRRPWCWDWSQAKGIWILFDQVPASQVLHVLNASLVALTGDKENPDSDGDTRPSAIDQQHLSSTNSTNGVSGRITSPLNYFPLGLYPPPPPEHTTCHGLAIIRSIQPSTHTLHILTPIPQSKLQKCNGIVKGAIHMPLHANLDHNEENNGVPGIAGVPWKKVPYLNYETPAGTYVSQSPSGIQSPRLGLTPAIKIIGSDAKVTRKNLGRKRLQ